jgi:hypothetical protein
MAAALAESMAASKVGQLVWRWAAAKAVSWADQMVGGMAGHLVDWSAAQWVAHSAEMRVAM